MLITLILAMLAGQDPAQGWQYASWGMSPSEVAAASSGQVRLVEDDSEGGRAGQTLAEGDALAGPFPMKAKFGFHEGRLSGVYLSTSGDRECGNLGYWLDDLYGPSDPPFARDGSFRSWRLPDQNKAIVFNAQGSACSLSYRAIRHQGNQGL